MSNMLEVKNLCKSYGAFALSNVSFTVPAGFITGFIGPNGAGKTTTIKSILGMVKLDGGSVFVPAQGEIGVVLDAPLYVEEWRVREVETALRPFYPNWDGAKFARHIEKFGIDTRKKVKELSRGMKVKLQIAAALSHNAKLLLLDEPTSGLDPVARDEVCDLLREFVSDENKSVLYSTHITTDLEKTADYVTFILGGKIVFTGTKDALLEKYARVTGGRGELSAQQKNLVIGCREHGTGFEGMALTKDISQLHAGVLTEAITLDEIIIYMNREAKINE